MNAPNDSIKILLVEDHAVVRTGLRLLLESRPDLEVVGEAADRTATLSLVESKHPNIVLLDVDLGEENGLEFLSDIYQVGPKVKVILLTAMRDDALYEHAVGLGALGIVHKETAAEVLIQAIEKVYAGETWLDLNLTARVLQRMSRGTPPEALAQQAHINSLTPREREIIAAVAEGLKNREIGERLFISETTVRHHLTSIFSKLEVSDRLELLIYAYRHRLAKKPL